MIASPDPRLDSASNLNKSSRSYETARNSLMTRTPRPKESSSQRLTRVLVARRNSSLALLAKEVAKREDEARFEDSRIETRDDSEEEEGGLSQDSRAAERREVIASLLDRSEQQERRAQKIRMLAEELMDIALVERTLGRMVLRQSQQLNEGKGEGISD